MQSLPEPVFDRMVTLASRLLKTPVGLVSLVGEDYQFFKAEHGLEEAGVDTRILPLTYSFCKHVVESGQKLVVTDAPNDPRVSDNLSITEMGVRSYLGIPLTTARGHTFGSVCVLDMKTRNWTDDEIKTLSDVASAVQSEISLRLALNDANRIGIDRDLLMGELNHRVKNLFAMVSGMIGMTARNSDSPQDMAEALRGRINALASAHALVQPAISGEAGIDNGISLSEIARVILAPHSRDGGIKIDGDPLFLDSDIGANISLVLHELATNAAKYGAFAHPDGSLSLSWAITASTVSIKWFEFNPSLQILPPETVTSGFGTRLIEAAIQRQMGGTIQRDWRPEGVTVTIDLPLSRIAPSRIG
jgi:two-component sensor histidine kinase